MFNPISQFRYHSTIENNGFLRCPNPNHAAGGGSSDFGNGFYLSDDPYGSLCWGARHMYPDMYETYNVYDVGQAALESLHYIVLTDNYADILRWATTTARNMNISTHAEASSIRGIIEVDGGYLLEVRDFDWILSRRTDDAMFTYLQDFFEGNLSFQGLLIAYDELSFGDELVLKTQRAIDCITFNEVESDIVMKYDYQHKYDEFVGEKSREYNQTVVPSHNPNTNFNELSAYKIAQCILDGEDWMQYV